MLHYVTIEGCNRRQTPFNLKCGPHAAIWSTMVPAIWSTHRTSLIMAFYSCKQIQCFLQRTQNAMSPVTTFSDIHSKNGPGKRTLVQSVRFLPYASCLVKCLSSRPSSAMRTGGYGARAGGALAEPALRDPESPVQADTNFLLGKMPSNTTAPPVRPLYCTSGLVPLLGFHSMLMSCHLLG